MAIPNDGRTPQDEIEEMMKAIEEEIANDLENKEKEEKNEEEEERESDESNEQEEENDESNNENEEDDKDENKENDDENGDEKFEPITVNINGKDIQLTEKTRIKELLEKAINTEVGAKKVTKSTADKMLEQFELGQDDLELLANVKKGDKAAIAKLLKDLEVDEIDVTEAENYNPQIKYQEESEIDQIANEILADENWTQQYYDVKKHLPSDFIEKVETDAALLKSFSSHVKSGLAQEIIPLAIQHVVNNGGDFLTAYDTAGRALVEEKQKEFNKAKKPEREVDKEARERMQRNKNSQAKDTFSVEDVSTMNEKELEEFQKSIANMK